MEWFVFPAVVIWIGYRLFGSENCQHDKNHQSGGDTIVSKGKEDDFSGGSVGSYFLMEEFIDPHIDGQKSANQGLFQSELSEDGYFEDEFFE
ncbi:MAG: hypothetical protein KJ804_19825 [Proteobacteria bacterium]|nr:hypothetical protein [Pseudomonadota bacterium]